jgi:hypothetical protein
VFAPNGSPSFPIDSVSRLEIPSSAGVVHTTYFASPDARRKMKEWLSAETPVMAGSPDATGVPQAIG